MPNRFRLASAAPASGWLRLLLLLPLTGLLGCPSSGTDSAGPVGAPQRPAEPLRVLVVDDPEMAAAIERHWQSLQEGDIEIKQAEAAQVTGGENKRLAADVVVYPSGLLGELAERSLISPLSSETLEMEALARRDIFSLVRLREVRWGEEVYAVPLGSPTLVLFYRADLLRKLELKPPTTWSEYLDTARQLSDREAVGLADENVNPWNGVAEPLAKGWAGQTLLARAAASVRHRSQYSALFDYREMRPLIDGPGFVRALEELAEAAALGPPQAKSYTPHDVRRAFLAGHCGLALSWPSRVGSTDSPLDADVEVGFAELPGADQVYNFRAQRWDARAGDESPHVTLLGIDGRLGSATRECRQPRAATNLLLWLCGREFAPRVAGQSRHTTLFRNSQLGSPTLWVDQPLDETAAQMYADTLELAHSRARWLCSIRIPGRLEYLAALDEAVHAVLSGESTAEQALQKAAQRWTEVTNQLGLDKQRAAYMRSIGLEP